MIVGQLLAQDGVRLMDSSVGKALIDWFTLEAGDHVLAAARDGHALRRPPSDDLAAIAAFDEALRGSMSEALGIVGGGALLDDRIKVCK